MEGVSRGAKERGGRVVGITSGAFRARANRWVDEEIRVESWRDRLFELVRRGDGYVACKGGTGTLAELAVVWEMQNKGLMGGEKPFVVLDNFWTPVLYLMCTVEREHRPDWGGPDSLAAALATPREAADYLAARLLGVAESKGKSARFI
jgi:predicted Rossmann-fold nucleotide-binding protein